MTSAAQRRLAVFGVVVAVALFVLANAHLFATAFRSEPACVSVEGAAPARRVC